MDGVSYPEARPLSPIESEALELQQSIANLEARIERLREEPEDLPLHDTLDSLTSKLRKAKLKWDRLPPMPGLPPPVPTSERRLQLHQIFRRTDGDVAANPRPRVMPGVGIIDRLPDGYASTMTINDDKLMTDSGRESNSPEVPDFFRGLSRGHARRHVSSSTPTIVRPQPHAEAQHAVIEDLATDDQTDSGPVAGEGLDEGGNRTVTEGTSTDPIPEPKVRSDTRNPVAAAAPPHSPPHDDADREQAASIAQPNRLVDECSAWANFFASERERPDPTPDAGSQKDEMESDAAPIIDDDDNDDGAGTSSSAASSRPNLPSTTAAARESTTEAPFSLDVDEALIEELYGDGY